MNYNYLFPHRFKWPAALIFIPTAIFGIVAIANDIQPEWLNSHGFAFVAEGLFKKDVHMSLVSNNLLDEILGVTLIISGLIFAFSKEKNEDEYIQKIRLDSLVWATYVNYGILLLAIIFIYDMSFLWVMIINLFTIIVFFSIRFNWQLSLLQKLSENEE